jgi:beta-phosphoglucomutase
MTDVLGAIWDMDGTLVDTAELHFRAWQAVCRELGRDFTREDFAATFGQRNPEILAHLFGNIFDRAREQEIGARKEELYRAEARQGVRLLPGVEDLLRGLHEVGFRQAIGSSAPLANLDLILELTGIRRYLQAVVGAEQTTRGKPDPQVFLMAAEQLGVEPRRCVVFEDAVAGIEAARNGGMKSVAVRFVGHHPEEKLRQAGADLVVSSLEAVRVRDVLDLLGGERTPADPSGG